MGKNFKELLLTVIFIAVPGAGAFIAGVTQDSTTMLRLAVAWIIVATVGSFLYKVWQKLEEPLVDTTAGAIRDIVSRIFSRYRGKYLGYLTHRHGDFDVKGLSTQGIYTLELEHVFVELSVAPQVPHQISSDPIHILPEELQTDSHIIWDYLRAEQIRDQNLAIIGPPGSGKTTLLKHITLTLAAGRKHCKQVGAPHKLPVLLFLRNHVAAIAESEAYSLADATQAALRIWKMEAPGDWFEKQLVRGHCLVMLDGLDEVADFDLRRKVVSWVERQMEIFGHNRFIITSRPHGYRTNPLSKVMVLEVQPFSQEQVKRFINNWYRANEAMSAQKDDLGAQMRAQEGANDLLNRLHDAPALMDLAVNPLLLTMIATVHRYRSSLPGRRVELYAEICEVFLGKRQQARGMELDLTPAQKQRVLQPLAYHMMVHEQREIGLDEALEVIAEPLQLVSPDSKGDDFLQMIENSSGLLLERESGEYSFAHLTFQEFLAAVHGQEQQLETKLTARVTDSWWHETLRLYSAQADATPILRACLAEEQPSVAALTLALECVEEAREVQPDVRAELQKILEEWVEDDDPEKRRLVAETLLAMRLRRLRRVSDDKYVDDSLITHAEYQLFLDEMREQGYYYQPDHWLDFHFPNGQSHTPVAGVRPGDAKAFCAWLTSRETGDWTYRLPIEDEVDDITSHKGVGYWTTFGYVFVLASATAPANTAEAVMADFNHAVARALVLALDLGSESNRVLAPNLANVLDNAIASAHNSYFSKEVVLPLDDTHSLDRIITSSLNSDRASSTLSESLAHAVARAYNTTVLVSRRRVFVQINVEAFGHALAGNHSLDLDHTFIRAIVRDSDLAIASSLIPSQVSNLSQTLVLDLENTLDHYRTVALTPNRTLALAKALARAVGGEGYHTLASALASVLTRDLDGNIAKDLASSSERILASALAIVLFLTRETDRTGNSFDFPSRDAFAKIANAHNRSFIVASTLASTYARDLTSAIIVTLTRNSYNKENINDRSAVFGILRSYVREMAALMAISPLFGSIQDTARSDDEDRQAILNHVEDYLGLYIDFTILEKRIHGELPAFEGIRIVKERKKEEQAN